MNLCYEFFVFWPWGGMGHRVKCTLINPEACLALPGAVFHLSKMRAHVADDARVTSGALYLWSPHRVFRGLGLGFQGLGSKQPRSGLSATPYTYPEARNALKKIRNTDGKNIFGTRNASDEVTFSPTF